MKRIAIFASGSGSNAENIIRYFSNSTKIKVVSVLTNNPNAKVIERAKILNVSSIIFSKLDLYESQDFFDNLIKEVDYIILAGFLWLMPKRIIDQFPQKIINIHPALLPKYGGKGMFGMKVHQSVIDNKEKETGITIHYVNEKYDEGTIIFQKEVNVVWNDTSETVAEKVHQLEYEYYPKVIETVILKDEF
ncbi:MAG: phosphoribosylglycinamide formyltransferase [Flavobacteriaceae bacterium]|nr:phosphoribosylglycinamide formyltransferase [Flavobacteriaceae bacterium]